MPEERGRRTPPVPPGVATRAPTRAEWLGLALVVAVALGLRLAHWQQLRVHDPFFELPSVDERMYHEWARAIVAGDWLGEGVFLNGPLYPYFLAGIYALFGASLAAAKAVQCLLGALSCVLVWALARRLFDARVALLASLGLALYGMAIFYEGTLVVVNLQLPLTLAVLLAVVYALERPHAMSWLVAGALSGLSSLARPNVLLFVVFIAAWIPIALRGQAPRLRRALHVAAFLGGAALMVLPVTVRNRIVGDDWVLITHAGGLNLFIGNNPDSDGMFRVPRIFPRASADDPWEQRAQFEALAERASGREMAPSEVSAFWSGQVRAFIRANPMRWIRLELRKLALSVNGFEPWNIRSYTLTRDFSGVLHLPLLSFGWMAPLAFAGLLRSARAWRRLVPLYAMLGTTWVTLLAFFVLSRYRMPAVPVLLIFAAAALAGFADALRARRWRRAAGTALFALGCAGLVHLPLAREDLSVAYYNLGNRYRELARWDPAIDAYRESIRRNPGYISAHNNLAIAYESSGMHDAEAIAAWQRVRVMAEASGLRRYVTRADRHLETLRARAGADALPAAP